MRILVTGATGFVGVNVTRHMSREYDVCVFVRNKKKADELLEDVDIAVGEVLDEKSLEDVFDRYKFDAVVHIAGVIQANDLDRLYKVNRFGTRNVAKVAYKHGVKRFIYISSLAARGPDGINQPVSHYGNSKRQGELELLKYPFETTAIIRPPIIFGPYDFGLLPLFKLAKLGFVPTIDRMYSFLYVNDLAHLIDLTIKGLKPGVSVLYGASFTCNFDTFADMLVKASGKKCLKVKLPMAILELATLFDFKKSPFGKDKLREVKPKAWTCSNDEAERVLGFKVNCEPFRCVKETYDWYLSHGWI